MRFPPFVSHDLLWYDDRMNKILKEVIEHAETWPEEDQEELAEYAREIEARGPASTRCQTTSVRRSGKGWLRPIAGNLFRTRS